MAFLVFGTPNQGAYFVLLVLCGIFSIIAICLRFLATKKSSRRLGAEDYFALIAVLMFLARIGFTLDCLTIINGRTLDLSLDRDDYEQAFKMVFAADVITMLDQTFAKLSICALYHRIFGVNPVYRRWIYFLGGAQCATYIALLIVQFLQCRPLHKFWQYWADGECMAFSIILVALEPPNALVDFGLVILALVMIRPLQLKSSAKWKLRFLFGLGSLAGLFGFLKIGFAYNPDPAISTAMLGLWAAIQSVACIICCCAPVYRPLFPEGFWTKIASKVTTFSFRRSTEKSAASTESGPWQNAPLDSYCQGEGWLAVEDVGDSTRQLVTVGGQRHGVEADKGYHMGTIQVHKQFNVDFPASRVA